MGPSYSVRLTPQPGFFVGVKICSFCKKRARRPKKIMVTRTVFRPCVDHYDELKRGVTPRLSKLKFKLRSRQACTTRTQTTHTCCSREHELVCGRVVRNTWSFDKHGMPKNFFIIVHVPSLGKTLWVTIENVVDSLDSHLRVGQFVRPRVRVNRQLLRVTSVDNMPLSVQVAPVEGGAKLSGCPKLVNWVSPLMGLAYMSD